MMADEEAAAIKKEEKRLQEWEDRNQKIKQKLSRMGDVRKKSNQAEKELEMKILNDQLKKDKQEEEKEKQKKKIARDKLIAVKATLDK